MCNVVRMTGLAVVLNVVTGYRLRGYGQYCQNDGFNGCGQCSRNDGFIGCGQSGGNGGIGINGYDQ